MVFLSCTIESEFYCGLQKLVFLSFVHLDSVWCNQAFFEIEWLIDFVVTGMRHMRSLSTWSSVWRNCIMKILECIICCFPYMPSRFALLLVSCLTSFYSLWWRTAFFFCFLFFLTLLSLTELVTICNLLSVVTLAIDVFVH